MPKSNKTTIKTLGLQTWEALQLSKRRSRNTRTISLSLKAQINGHYPNRARLETMVAAWKMTREKLKMQIKDLNTNSQMTGHEENLTFMYHHIHGMSKEYEPRPACIGKLIKRLLTDLEVAKTQLKKLVNVSKRSKERSNAICNAVLISESPSEELTRDYSMAKMTVSHYLSEQGSRTYVLKSKEQEAQTKYGWDLAVQPYHHGLHVYEAKFGEITPIVDARYDSGGDGAA